MTAHRPADLPLPVRVGEPGEWEPTPKATGVDGFSSDESGLLLPTPKGIEVRQLVFESGGALHVEQSQEEIKRRIGHMRDSGGHWLELTTGGYGVPVSIPAEAVEHIMWIAEAWMDVESIREQIKAQEMARRQAKTGLQKVQGRVVPFNGRRN